MQKVFNFAGRNFGNGTETDAKGYVVHSEYRAEDVYWMKKSFALRTNWFLTGHPMYFEDIHICHIKGVCEFEDVLRRITRFPAYFNLSRIYHMEHDRYYYQVRDPECTVGLLDLKTEDPILKAHQEAIRLYRQGKLTEHEAVTYTHRNQNHTGTQNWNFHYHMLYLEKMEGMEKK